MRLKKIVEFEPNEIVKTIGTKQWRIENYTEKYIVEVKFDDFGEYIRPFTIVSDHGVDFDAGTFKIYLEELGL